MPDHTPPPEQPLAVDRRRRALLLRLGLATGAAYVAPALTSLGLARASGSSGASVPSGVSGPAADGGGARAQAPRRAPAPQRAAPRPALPAPPELVVLLPFGQDPAAAVAAGYGIIAQAPAPIGGATLLRLRLASGRTAEAARAELATLLPGALADENHLYSPDEMLCGPDGCAAQAMIGWTGWPSASAPRIGMIDTGINLTHAALEGQKLSLFQIDLGEREAAGRQHGTAIAAQLVGRLDGRVPGLLPMAELVAVEAFHSLGGVERADAFSLVQGIETLVGAEVSVINLSFSGPENAVLRQVVERAAAAGIALVAAAGNGGPGAEPAYPAAWPEVVAVTAVDGEGRAYRQANRGPYITLAAPGVNLWTAASVSGGRLRSGTSYAAPFVTATLAVERMRNPGLSVEDVVAGVVACAADLGEAGFDPVYGHGLVSAPGQCAAAGPYLTSGGGG